MSLLYGASNQPAKAARTTALLLGGGTVSVQVLDEFASVALRKLGQSMPDVRNALTAIRSVCTVVVADTATHELGLDIAERYNFSIYDSMLLAAAQKANCTTFFSEGHAAWAKSRRIDDPNPFRP
ncbi:MAG: PIN domain-containing protein [Rhizomicrobium sp.]